MVHVACMSDGHCYYMDSTDMLHSFKTLHKCQATIPKMPALPGSDRLECRKDAPNSHR
jgi:hypothetical protein